MAYSKYGPTDDELEAAEYSEYVTLPGTSTCTSYSEAGGKERNSRATTLNAGKPINGGVCE